MTRPSTSRPRYFAPLPSPAPLARASRAGLFGLCAAALLAGSAFAQPEAPFPHGFNTRRDVHPQVQTDANGNLVFRNQHLVAVLAKRAEGYGPLRIYPATRPTRSASEPAAIVNDLAQITWREGSETRSGTFTGTAVRIKGDDRAILTGTVQQGNTSWAAEVQLSIDREPWLSWSAKAQTPASTALLRFSGMPLQVTRRGAGEALFPGHLFTQWGGGEPTTPTPTQLIVPNPYQITVPVMSLSQAESTVALMWDMQQPSGTPGLPSALFTAGEEGSTTPARMELFLPGIPKQVEPDHEQATEALEVAANTELSLAGKILVLPDNPNPTAAIRQWSRAYADRFRELDVKEPRTREAERRLSLGALERDPGDPTPMELVALQVENGLAGNRRGGRPATARLDQRLEALRGAGPIDPRIAYRTGGVIPSLAAAQAEVYALADEQLPDGSWAVPLQPTANEVELPGLRGAGITTMNALQLLRHAVLTGDTTAAASGLRALDYLSEFTYGRPHRRYRIPRMVHEGGSTPSLPSLFVAADTAEAFLVGYQVSGEVRYLERARYWADTGLPFIYLWSDRSKQVLPGAALPVLGERPGIAEQQAGLAFARVLKDLDRSRDDDLYEKVIHAILASAMHQQAATGADAGTFPLRWNVVANQGEGARVPPDLLLSLLHEVEGYDADVSHRRIRVGSDRLFVSTGATIRQAESTAMRLRLDLHWVGNTETITTIAGVPSRPISVEYNTSDLRDRGFPAKRRFLPEATSAEQPGWHYDEVHGVLTLRLRHNGGTDELEIRWPDPKDRFPVDRIDRRANNRRGT